ncbi:MAG: hypothetical protein AAFQ82_25585 [Myxococcota bacterium]
MKTPRWRDLILLALAGVWLSGAILLPSGAPEWQIGLFMGASLPGIVLLVWIARRSYLQRSLYDRTRLAYRAIHALGPCLALLWAVSGYWILGWFPNLELSQEQDLSKCEKIGDVGPSMPSATVDVGVRIVAKGQSLYRCPKN